ncbi:MAG: DUF7014 domain-containing protein, partial [Limisphaerales bacterium]
DFNDSVGIQPDPNDRWIQNSNIQTEAANKLRRLYGTDTLVPFRNVNDPREEVGAFILRGESPQVFDALQVWYDFLEGERQRSFQQELNAVLEDESVPWCFCEQSFFQLDSRFLEEHLLARANELMTSSSHHGALQEFVEARNDFSAGDYKGTILNCCKAYESVLQTLVERKGGQAGDLIKGLSKAGLLDDIPENLRHKFETTFLQTVPWLRNTMAGHGQGSTIVTVSRDVAELCLHFSGALILFLVKKHLDLTRPPTPAPTESPQPDGDDVPF